ncbi:MAG: 2,3,4,5-tetrahydropyridine-2,6-dicarboxylate N-succinyltransferase [Candidatus Kapaibacteriales bacterium]
MEQIIKLIEELEDSFDESTFDKFYQPFLNLLNEGKIRAAEKMPNGNWKVNEWVKRGILLLFKFGKLIDMSIGYQFHFFDKHTLSLKKISLEDKIRLVPGGSAIRNGCYVAPEVICMPPTYINIGAYIDVGCLIDSHSLVGSCAQIGKNVHLSAGSQIGGVLEPIGAFPVIVEDNVFIGGNCGIYEGVRIGNGAVIASGVVLTSSTKVYDLVTEKIIQMEGNNPLVIPPNAVVVAGCRSLNSPFAREYGISIYTPLIIKYRDKTTQSKVELETILRAYA